MGSDVWRRREGSMLVGVRDASLSRTRNTWVSLHASRPPPMGHADSSQSPIRRSGSLTTPSEVRLARSQSPASASHPSGQDVSPVRFPICIPSAAEVPGRDRETPSTVCTVSAQDRSGTGGQLTVTYATIHPSDRRYLTLEIDRFLL